MGKSLIREFVPLSPNRFSARITRSKPIVSRRLKLQSSINCMEVPEILRDGYCIQAVKPLDQNWRGQVRSLAPMECRPLQPRFPIAISNISRFPKVRHPPSPTETGNLRLKDLTDYVRSVRCTTPPTPI